MIKLDGAIGEGGGQILRSSLALSAVTGQSFRMENIRGNRKRPGLMRQHLTATLAAAEICDAQVNGTVLGSRDISFKPKAIKAGHYEFSVGTAGSANLVLQTVLPMLLHATGPSTVVVKGGTHNMASPPFEFLDECYLPALRAIGYSVTAELKSYGFYPAGGGEIEVSIAPAQVIRELAMIERGPETSRSLTAMISNLPDDIAERELRTAMGMVNVLETKCSIERPASAGPGNVLYGRLTYENVTSMFVQFGQLGVSAKQVAKRLSKSLNTYASNSAVVTHHLADQLLLPMALAKGGEFTTLRPSLHAETNADVIHRFTGRQLGFQETGSVYSCCVSGS